MMYVRAFAALVVCDALVAPAVTTRRASSLRAYKTPDLVSVFARLAETTCVSEDGRTQTAKAGKWIPAYAKRGDHVPAWVGALFPDGATDVGFDACHAALRALPYAAPLAAPPSEAARASVSADAARAFWAVAGGGESLALEACVAALEGMAPEGDGAMWDDYAEACNDVDVERVTDVAQVSFAEADWDDSLKDAGSAQLLGDVGAAPPPPPPGAGAPPPPPPPPGEVRTAGGLILP